MGTLRSEKRPMAVKMTSGESESGLHAKDDELVTHYNVNLGRANLQAPKDARDTIAGATCRGRDKEGWRCYISKRVCKCERG